MEISISDDQSSFIEEKPWFEVIEKKQHNIVFDVDDKYTFNDFKECIKNDKQLHIIAPLFPDCYDLYRDIIKGTESKHIMYIDDIIEKEHDNQYNEDQGLEVLKKIEESDIVVHIVYLGDSFMANYLNKKKQNITNQAEIKEIEQDVEEIEQIEKNYYTLLSPPTEYMSEFINYNFGTQYMTPKKDEQIEINPFEYFADDIVKLLFVLMDKNVEIREYDMMGRNLVEDLRDNLGFYA